MKRPAQWEQSFPISSDDSSDSDSGDDGPAGPEVKAKIGGSNLSKAINSEGKKRHGGLDLEALSRHGYKGAPSVLKVPPPRVVENKEQDWSWSTGKRGDGKDGTVEESYEERERTRAALAEGERLLDVQRNENASAKDKKKSSFSQKEKRKRDLGQASRGKSYVEEEKRLLRDSGIYSGFDS